MLTVKTCAQQITDNNPGHYIERCDKCEQAKEDLRHVWAPDLKPTNPKDRAATNRLDLSLFPATARAYGALGMVEGDCKYGGYNYRVGGVLASIYYAAAGRHLDKWFNGEDCDKKSGVPHLASALACIAVLIDAVECGVLKDDRPPTCDMAGLLERFEDKVRHLHAIFPDGPERFVAGQPNELTPGMKVMLDYINKS